MLLLLASVVFPVAPAPPQSVTADFEARPLSGRAPLEVRFRDASSGPILHWRWSFGDGTVSLERDPVHVYDRPGSYDVTLTVRGRTGFDTRVVEDFVRVAPDSVRQAFPNLALVVLDDVGVDRLAVYGETPTGSRPACTPNLDALAAEGLLFRRAYANPLCSSTRAQILTGRHGFRTGIGGLITSSGEGPGLSLRERTLPELLAFHDSAAIGKWHLAPPAKEGLQHPLRSG